VYQQILELPPSKDASVGAGWRFQFLTVMQAD